MSLVTKYEGAIYYFDKAHTYINDENYEDAMESLTKGYKSIQDTSLISDTKSRHYTEVTVNAIQDERKEDAMRTAQKLKLIVEVWQKNNIIKSQEN